MAKFHLALITAILFLGAMSVSSVSPAEQDPNIAGYLLTSKLPGTQHEAVVSAALRTLRHITEARNAIHSKDLNNARKETQRAQELLALVEAARPTVRVKEHLWIARQHLEYDSPQNVVDDLTLIEVELLSLGGDVPTGKAHRLLKSAGNSLNKNDIDAARRELAELEASLSLTELDLPLAVCEQRITAAQEALASNRASEADESLMAAEKSIQFITVGGTAPLVIARSHLSRAAKEYAEKYYATADADLAQASEWLRRITKDYDEKGQKEAREVASEIDALRKKLDAKEQDHTQTLSSFLHRTIVLIERDAHDLWLRYRRQQATNQTLQQLLDAKTHLRYAEHDLVRGRNIDSVRKQLETADRYLEEALANAEPSLYESIEQLREQAHALEGDLESDPKRARIRYEQILADLRLLIQEH